MLLHVLDALELLPLERIVVVVGHAAEHVTKTLQEQLTGDVPVEFVEQHRQRGTGDAVSVALTANAFDHDLEDDLIVVAGDVPLLRAETLARLATEHRRADAAASLLTARVPDPTGYGRIVRDEQGRVDRIVEQADADADELAIDEVNPSIYCFRRGLLAPALRRLSPENAQGEYYLTDVVAVLRQAGHVVLAVEAEDPTEALRRQRPRPARRGRGRAAGADQRPLDARGRRHDRSRPHLPRHHRRARARRPAAPGHDARRPHRRRRGSVIGPDTQLVDTVVGEDAIVRQTVARDVGDRRRRHRRPVRVAAARHPRSPPARTSARSSR